MAAPSAFTILISTFLYLPLATFAEISSTCRWVMSNSRRSPICKNSSALSPPKTCLCSDIWLLNYTTLKPYFQIPVLITYLKSSKIWPMIFRYSVSAIFRCSPPSNSSPNWNCCRSTKANRSCDCSKWSSWICALVICTIQSTYCSPSRPKICVYSLLTAFMRLVGSFKIKHWTDLYFSLNLYFYVIVCFQDLDMKHVYSLVPLLRSREVSLQVCWMLSMSMMIV